MLVYFFDHDVWWVRDSAGTSAPAQRQVDVFIGISQIAKKRREEQSTEGHRVDDTEAKPGIQKRRT
jgi:hypothetical protein